MIKQLKNTKAFYTDTIPYDWDIIALDKIVRKPIVYGIVQAGPEIQDGVFYIKSTDVGDDIIVSKLCKTSKAIAAKYSRSEVYPGDIVFSLRGNIGELSIVPENLEVANLTQGTARISVDLEKYNNYFIKYVLHATEVFRNIIQASKGSTFSEISLGELRKVNLPIPPLAEQKMIAHLLRLLDKAIFLNNQLVFNKEKSRKWLMQNLLTGKKRIKQFSESWKEYTYEKLLKVVKRPVIWNDKELYNLISVRRRSGGIFLREALYGHQIKVKDLRDVEEGDFLFSKMQILHGASALVTKEFAGAKISGSYIAVVPKDPTILNMEFFSWYTKDPYFYHQTYISSYGVHIEKMTFDFETFLSLEMKLPSKEEQTAITIVLKTADTEIQILKAKLEKLKEQKKGLMQLLLTGKKRLKIKTD